MLTFIEDALQILFDGPVKPLRVTPGWINPLPSNSKRLQMNPELAVCF